MTPAKGDRFEAHGCTYLITSVRRDGSVFGCQLIGVDERRAAVSRLNWNEGEGWTRVDAVEAARTSLMAAGRRRATAMRTVLRLTEELEGVAVRADAVGLSRREIADHGRVDRRTLYEWLRKAGRPMSSHHGGKR